MAEAQAERACCAQATNTRNSRKAACITFVCDKEDVGSKGSWLQCVKLQGLLAVMYLLYCVHSI